MVPCPFQRFRYRYFLTSGMGFQRLPRWRYQAVDLQYTTVRLRRPHSIDGMDLPSYCLHGHNSIQYQSHHKVLLSHGRIRNTVLHDIQALPMQYSPCFYSSHLHKNSYFPDRTLLSVLSGNRSSKQNHRSSQKSELLQLPGPVLPWSVMDHIQFLHCNSPAG